MEIKELYSLYQAYSAVCTDSRSIVENSIFFALKGGNFNGNEFAETALEKGCKYAVIDEEIYRKDERYILVDDTLKTLQELAKYHRKNIDIPVIGITGTNGKTTTKELISAVLAEKYKVVATVGNLNNHIGVPLTILSVKEEHEIAIVEMGANHISEIEGLCEISQPEYGIITNIGKAHLEGFGSLENIIKAKTELYEFLKNNDGIAFVNADNPLLVTASENVPRKVLYGKDTAEFKGELIGAEPFVSIAIETENKKQEIKTKLAGEYNFENILAAAFIGNYFDVGIKRIKEAIEKYEPQNNRSQILKTKNNLLVLDAYNANPSSLKAALENFIKMKYENKVFIIGDMLELGKYSEEEHNKIISFLNENNVKNVLFVGNVFSKINKVPEYKTFENVDTALNWFKTNKIENSSIFIKGSRGIKLEKLIDAF
ncbi:MAG: UDP-N-acetylmuramoyl-tripeptide--D-alanyl-D-alanine ligase [Bacteroidales bacterium]|nr:UDP-N-acetylmuramoyl-tripeptide--D-alanyl-D-alanine ligase [Bacteroidales bacterium]